MPLHKKSLKKKTPHKKTLPKGIEKKILPLDNSSAMHRIETLHQIALQIDSAGSIDEILDIIRREAKWLLTFEACFIGLLNRSLTHYVIHTLSPIADASELGGKHFPVDEGTLGWVIRNNTSFIGEIQSNPTASPMLEGRLEDLGIKSMLVVPLQKGNDVIGSLAFGSINPKCYTEEDSTIAQLFGLYAATAIKNTSIFEDAQKRLTQIELISEVSSRLTSLLQLAQLLDVAATAIQKTFNYFDVTVFLLSDDKSELILEAHSGSFADFLPKGYRQKVAQGIIGWVVQEGKKVICDDVSLDPRYKAYEYHNTKSELALPIKIEHEVVGVLNVEDTKIHAFDETDAVVLETLADQLGSGIKNAKLYEEIRQANMKLTELDKEKSEFLGIVSHDFRSPLSSIMLAAKSLLKNPAIQGVQRVKDYLLLIVTQANRLNQLAEDTLSITKIESGRLSYYFKIVNVQRLIQDALSSIRFSSRHQLDFKIDPNILFIKGDQAKLRQLVQNLISNAVKYSPGGGKISVIAEDSPPEHILVSVADEGIGIPSEKVEKLFQKFSRIDTTEAKGIRGAGLGLWICKEVVQAHGGKIWVEGKPGKGSIFKFTVMKEHPSVP